MNKVYVTGELEEYCALAGFGPVRGKIPASTSFTPSEAEAYCKAGGWVAFGGDTEQYITIRWGAGRFEWWDPEDPHWAHHSNPGPGMQPIQNPYHMPETVEPEPKRCEVGEPIVVTPDAAAAILGVPPKAKLTQTGPDYTTFRLWDARGDTIVIMVPSSVTAGDLEDVFKKALDQ